MDELRSLCEILEKLRKGIEVRLENVERLTKEKAELQSQSKNEEEFKKLLKRFLREASISEEIEYFAADIVHNSSLMDGRKKYPLLAEAWYGDMYEDVDGVDALNTFATQLNLPYEKLVLRLKQAGGK